MVMSLTGDNECKANTYDAEVPQAPEIHLVEENSSIYEAAQLIISESDNPDIHGQLESSNRVFSSFHEDRVVKEQERKEERGLKRFSIYRHSEARVRVCCSRFIKSALRSS